MMTTKFARLLILNLLMDILLGNEMTTDVLNGMQRHIYKKAIPACFEDSNSNPFYKLQGEFELAYDDGSAEGLFVPLETTNGAYIAVKFVSPLPSFRLQRVRCYFTGPGNPFP